MTLLDVRIDSIAAGGDGVGRHDGLVVFVPRTAPGDLVRVNAEQHDRLMRASVAAVLEPSPQRREPPCDHYVNDRCGGCQIQHLRYDAQLAAKSGIIRDAMTRIGRVAVDQAPEVQASSDEFRYRLKLTLALRRRGGRWIAGLHRFDAPHEVFELRDCPITQEPVLDSWREVLAAQEWLPEASRLRGAVRISGSDRSFTLEGGDRWPKHEDFFAATPGLTQLWWAPEDRSRRLLLSRSGDAAGASFAQVNPEVATEMRARVVALAESYRPRTLVDAYAGTGDYAVALARSGVRVTAIELDRDAARVAAERLPDPSRSVAAAVEAVIDQSLPSDVVILNPPRAGVHVKVTEALQRQTELPRAIIYVSCNPATLARDARRLDRYRVKSLAGFDMFPQTAHVETVCELVPAA
jgi:23S rRNA (uracil1939-C5)-methyltransferase